MRVRLLVASVLLATLVIAPVAAAGQNPRAKRTVAGVRATINAYDDALLAGNGRAACAVVTPAGQRTLERTNRARTCEEVIEVAYQVLKGERSMQRKLRSYGRTVHVTLRGNTATVPQFNERGTASLIYVRGLWMVNG